MADLRIEGLRACGLTGLEPSSGSYFRKRMLRVALTGGIATGKSYVLARFAALGVPTVDADALVHEALAAGSPAVPRVAARFGRGVIAADGSVDRRALGALIFNDAAARADLEAILHPEVFRRIDVWFSSLPGSDGGHVPVGPPPPGDGRFAIADIPLLFETHHDGLFDRIVVTRCDAAQQIQRLKERNGMGDEEARLRLKAQWPIDEKARRAHYVIETGGTFLETDAQVDRVFEALEEDARF